MGPDGLIRVWLDRKFVDRLVQMRGPGESYSDVILRVVRTGSQWRLAREGWAQLSRRMDQDA